MNNEKDKIKINLLFWDQKVWQENFIALKR